MLELLGHEPTLMPAAVISTAYTRGTDLQRGSRVLIDEILDWR